VPLFLGLYIFLNNRKDVTSRSYFGLSLGCTVWALGFFLLISATEYKSAYFFRTIMDIGAIILPSFWIHFVYSVLNLKLDKSREIILWYFLGIVLVAVNIFDYFSPGLFISGLSAKGVFEFYPVAGIGYYFFVLVYLMIIPRSMWYLFRGYRKYDGIKSQQIKYFGVASLIGFGGGATAFFYTFNIMIAPYGVVLFALYPIIIAYGITRHQLFNIKVVVTEIFVAALSIFVLTRTILADTGKEMIINGTLFLAVTVTGYYLIRSSLKEIAQREKIEKLASDLTAANTKLQGLDQLKSEFVSLASHQLRGPLTAIKGYTSEIIEGDFGEVPKHLFQPLHTILKSCQSLVTIVEDFLNVSRMEQGKMTYDRTFFDMADLIEEVVRENQPNFDRKKLKVYVMASQGSNVEADRGKIKQIVGNLIDNSIKYTPAGEVHVGVARNADKIVFSVKDTGVGIRRETMPKLFQKFSRAEDASKANILGTGLGLYIASQMIKAHGGRIWAESAGEGKGSAFFVELLAA